MVRAVATNEEQVKALLAAEKDGLLAFWKEPRRLGGFVDFRVPPQKTVAVATLLQEQKVMYTTTISNIRP